MLRYAKREELHRDAQGGYIGVFCEECEFEGYVDDKYNLNQLIQKHQLCKGKEKKRLKAKKKKRKEIFE